MELKHLLNEPTDDAVLVEASRYDPELLADHPNLLVMAEP
ncbi:hypothetical protein KR49_09780 [Synechococcus sp. KORDI-49]|nr:hypothetical protein KR49_09780 [Synechococcus sp. KORDI-49]